MTLKDIYISNTDIDRYAIWDIKGRPIMTGDIKNLEEDLIKYKELTERKVASVDVKPTIIMVKLHD